MSTATTNPSPPLPPDLSSHLASFHRSATEIRSFQLPRLRTCTTPSQLTDYESELTSSLQGLARIATALHLAVDDAESASQRKVIADASSSLARELESTRAEMRKALVAARRNVENARTNEAREGLRLAADGAKERSGGRGGATTGEDKLMTTSQDVTDALRRTVSLMSGELEKSFLSSTLLEESSQTLTTLSGQYGSLSTLMANSAAIIRTMEREDLIGKGMLALSVLFFAACVGYILYVRIVAKGLGVVAFFWRVLGFGRLVGGRPRSVEDVQEKVEMVKQAVQQSSGLAEMLGRAAENFLSTTTTTTSSSIAAAITSAVVGGTTAAVSQVQQQPPPSPVVVQEKVWDVQDQINNDDDDDDDGEKVPAHADEETPTTQPAEDLFEGDRATLTRQYTRPTEHVEL